VPRENDAMSTSGEHRTQPRAGSFRGTATAQRIERCAVALVITHGFDATTVDMICAEAGVSQRTFFNHFATKDAAVLGSDGPRLDESRVRAFIASDAPSILADAIALISFASMPSAIDSDLMRQRVTAISSSAVLMQRQLERFAAIEDDLAEVIRYRLARVSGPEESGAETAEQARLTAHILAGIMRYSASTLLQSDSVPVATVLTQTLQRLDALLPKLVP